MQRKIVFYRGHSFLCSRKTLDRSTRLVCGTQLLSVHVILSLTGIWDPVFMQDLAQLLSDILWYERNVLLLFYKHTTCIKQVARFRYLP